MQLVYPENVWSPFTLIKQWNQLPRYCLFMASCRSDPLADATLWTLLHRL